MSLTERISLYKKVENLRNRPLIVYITSTRPGIDSRMATDAIPELLDQLEHLPQGANAIDLLVVSQGGDPTMAWRAMTLIRERVEKIAVLVPQAAYSAATLLALGADEIIMHPNGNLGPVDPQIEVREPGKPNQRFGYEELTGFLEFVRKQVGLTDQEHIRQMFELFCKQVGPIPVGVAARGSLLSLSMGEKLLRMHMTGDANMQKARSIAESLNKSFFDHGYPVGRKEAAEIGLNIPERNHEIEVLMWSIWRDIEDELKIRRQFSPHFELMASPEAAKLFAAVPQLNLPPNINQQVLQQVVQQLLQTAVATVDPVDFEVVTAIMESRRVASRDVLKGKVMACRMPDLNLRVNAVTTKGGWENYPIPAPPANA